MCTATHRRKYVGVSASVLNILDFIIWVRDTARLTFIMARLTFMFFKKQNTHLYGWLVMTTHNRDRISSPR
jgi:hypothetical protein